MIFVGHAALLSACDSETVFPFAVATQLALALLGPGSGQLNMSPKMPIHLFPLIAVCATTALSLAAL